jgi:hypothetical protein
MSVSLDKKTCDTMGCRNTATHVLTTPGLDPEDENTYTDLVCEPCGQGYLRRPALRATLAPMAQSEPAPTPQSGYTPCACRDCMDIAVSSDWTKSELCLPCKGEGCEPFRPGDSDYESLPGHMRECQREDAYGDEVGDAGTGHGTYEYRSGH